MQWLQTLCWSWKACFIVGHGWFGDGDAHWASALVRQVRHHRALPQSALNSLGGLNHLYCEELSDFSVNHLTQR